MRDLDAVDSARVPSPILPSKQPGALLWPCLFGRQWRSTLAPCHWTCGLRRRLQRCLQLLSARPIASCLAALLHPGARLLNHHWAAAYRPLLRRPASCDIRNVAAVRKATVLKVSGTNMKSAPGDKVGNLVI